jgi:cytochrome c
LDSFEWNKIVGALLGTVLFIVVVELAVEDLFEIEQAEVKGYKVEGLEEATFEEPIAEIVEGPSLANLLANASAEKGARVFGRCAACHSVHEGGAHGVGPNLYGIVGDKVGGRADFSYSRALENHGGTWDFALLDAYIENPAETIPDNRMPFSGISRSNQRADLITYLRLLAADPAPLPADEAVEPAVEEKLQEVIEEAAGEPLEAELEEPAVEVEVAEVAGAAAEVEPAAAAETMTEASPLVAALRAASSERGEAAFSVCAICHSIEKGGAHKIGPNLYGIVGAQVGRQADFSYSPALSSHGGTWDFEALDVFLTGPSQAIPGNRMPFGGIKSLEDRADLILFLRSRSDNLPELP